MTKEGPVVLGTVDSFVAAVPWGPHRTVLVIRREHSGREYVRFRIWNRHRTKGTWYPSRRSFVVPVQYADAMAEAIRAAARGEPLGDEPDWHLEFKNRYDPNRWRIFN
ncbi:MAG: hypothetical protein JSU86_05380 [Phycisphaerales bacterium]|nr:MAG: hypothetical protein JSU86_05380 [Phycisphaerales bacterium]